MEAKVLYTCNGCGKGIAPKPGDPVVSSNVLGWGRHYHWDCSVKRYAEIKQEKRNEEAQAAKRRSLGAMNAAVERMERRERAAAQATAAELFNLPDTEARDTAMDVAADLFADEEDGEE